MYYLHNMAQPSLKYKLYYDIRQKFSFKLYIYRFKYL